MIELLYNEEGNVNQAKNFECAIELCTDLVKAFHPLLGIQTSTVVNICSKAKDTDYLNAKEFALLQISARLQNIGLLSLTRALISKVMEGEEELSEDEREFFEQHTVRAQKWTTFQDDLQDVGKIIRSSRERWDGKGFPDGLMRENIPKPSRFLATCVYYAESNKSHSETLDEMTKLSGRAFHPEAVRLFLKIADIVELPPKVRELLFSELKSGMVLAHPIHTPRGVLLFPKDEILNETALGKIKGYNEVEPIFDRILVYKEGATVSTDKS